MTQQAIAPIWRRIIRPKGATAALYKQSFAVKGILYGTSCREIMEGADYISGPNAFDIVKLKIADLGFTKGAKLDALYEQACSERCGLTLLPHWVLVELRDSYPVAEQPKGELLVGAMQPIVRPQRYPALLSVEHREGGSGWVNAEWACPDVWDSPNTIYRYTFLFGVA